jgi:hypothetical protein
MQRGGIGVRERGGGGQYDVRKRIRDRSRGFLLTAER